MTHICVDNLTIIGSDNGLSPGRRQAVIWTNAGILLIWPLGTNFSEILIKIYIFSFTKMHLKLSSGIWRPFCLGVNVLKNMSFTMNVISNTGPWSVNSRTHDCYPKQEEQRKYRKTSSINRTKSPNLNVSNLVLQLSLLNPLKPGIKSRMKM